MRQSEGQPNTSFERAVAVATSGAGRESRVFRFTRVTFEDGYLEFITGAGQRGKVPIHAVHFAGAEERREQSRDRDGRLAYENVAYLSLYGSGGTRLASGKCWMSTASQASDWINAVLNESRVRRSQGRTQSATIPSCERCGARGVSKGRFCANCGAPLADS